MRFALISDIHSNLTALRLILSELKEGAINSYIFLGDYISDGYHDAEILDIIADIGDYVIKGNREKILSLPINAPIEINQRPLKWTQDSLTKRNLELCQTMKEKITFDLKGRKVLLVHGDELLEEKPFIDAFDYLIKTEVFDVCIMGHIHESFDCTYKGKRFINPGSAGLPADGPAYSYAIMEITTEDIKVQYRSLPTKDTFNIIRKDYQRSEYFIGHPVWGTLVLDAILTGTATNVIFFDILKGIQLKNPNATYTRIWNLTFMEYRNQGSSTFEMLPDEEINDFETRFKEEMKA